MGFFTIMGFLLMISGSLCHLFGINTIECTYMMLSGLCIFEIFRE